VIVDHAIRGGAGADEVKLGLTQIVPAPVKSSLQVGLGQSNDKLEVLYGGVASNLTVSGGVNLEGGNDEMVFISGYPTAAALSLQGNDGFDLIKAEIQGPLSGWRTGVMRLLGGTGDDQLFLGVQGGGIESVIDGGSGFDIGFGPGRIVNCEIVN
jgi:Ca2+-binding RTX toxin-like protein